MKHSLYVTDFLNTYFIDGRKLNNIAFYDDNGLIGEVDNGWISGKWSNRMDIKEFDDLQAAYVRKINFDRKEHFFTKDKDRYGDPIAALYVYVPAVEGLKVVNVGEQVALSTDTNIHYGVFLEITATARYSRKFDFERQTIKQMQRGYTKTVSTDLGERVQRVKGIFEGCQVDAPSNYAIERVLKDKKAVEALKEVLA